jgi:cytochrome c oxidase accessory protein FixG
MSGSNPQTGQREWIYAAKVKGRFQRYHRLLSLVLYTVLFVTPWVKIGGHPALQLDLAARRMFFFGAVYTPRDSIFLVLHLLGAAFTLFFLTSLFGRLWCGFACPQTVFLEELIRPIERFWEGSRGKRMAADRKPLTGAVLARKVAKHASFALVAFLLAMALTSYITGPVPLWTGQATAGAYLGMAAVAGALFFDFAWFREQFCNYLCPYARFQGALTDEHSFVIEYDAVRGEPRMKGKAARQKAAKVGACIDCNKCVTVCPQGVDIRKGYQLECINCARCVDACTSVMDKLGHESLVRYTTQAERQGGKQKWLRPRTVAYMALLSTIATALLVLSNGRVGIEATVNRLPGSLYQVDADGWTRNTFMLNVSNNNVSDPLTVQVSLDGLPDAELVVPPITVDPAGAINVPLVVRVPPTAELDRTMGFDVQVTGDSGEQRVVHATFKSGTTVPLEG